MYLTVRYHPDNNTYSASGYQCGTPVVLINPCHESLFLPELRDLVRLKHDIVLKAGSKNDTEDARMKALTLLCHAYQPDWHKFKRALPDKSSQFHQLYTMRHTYQFIVTQEGIEEYCESIRRKTHPEYERIKHEKYACINVPTLIGRLATEDLVEDLFQVLPKEHIVMYRSIN